MWIKVEISKLNLPRHLKDDIIWHESAWLAGQSILLALTAQESLANWQSSDAHHATAYELRLFVFSLYLHSEKNISQFVLSGPHQGSERERENRNGRDTSLLQAVTEAMTETLRASFWNGTACWVVLSSIWKLGQKYCSGNSWLLSDFKNLALV